MKTTTASRPPHSSLDRGIVAVFGLGLLGATFAWASVGAPAAISVLIGSLIGASNLWAISRLVPRLMATEGPKGRWALLSALKVGLLLVVVSLLLSASLVDLLFLCLGYGALPLGILVGQLFPATQAHEEV